MIPQRIQRRRTKGWRMPEGAIYVGRPTKWGNPYRPTQLSDGTWVALDDNGCTYPGYGPCAGGTWPTRDAALMDCIRLFIELEVIGELGAFTRSEVRAALTGRELVCWCPLGSPCHADVLLELANQHPAHEPGR